MQWSRDNPNFLGSCNLLGWEHLSIRHSVTREYSRRRSRPVWSAPICLKFQILPKSKLPLIPHRIPEVPLGSQMLWQTAASLQVTWNCRLYEGFLVGLLDHLLAADPLTRGLIWTRLLTGSTHEVIIGRNVSFSSPTRSHLSVVSSAFGLLMF